MQQPTNVSTHVTNVVSWVHVNPDLRLIGGGSAGCMAAIAAREHAPEVAVMILDKGGPFAFEMSRLDVIRKKLPWKFLNILMLYTINWIIILKK